MTDVVIAGGGPVGLMLACELRLYGVSVTVVERLAEPDQTIKAGSISGRTAAVLDRRGLRDALGAAHQAALERMVGTRRAGEAAGRPRVLGHFAGIFKVGFPPDELPAALEVLRAHPRGLLAAGEPGLMSVGEPPMGVPQIEVERILAARAAELGAVVHRGCEVAGFHQDAAGVTAELADGGPVRARYLVGCDGGRSTVRKQAGFAFPGTDATITGHQAVVELADDSMLSLGWHRTDQGLMVYGPFPGRVLTVEFDGPPADRDAPVTREEVQASLRRVSGTDVTVTAVRTATRFTDNTRLADTYRRDRVLLAGDAAHVHSPFGGQGLNLGIQDAVNLGWKLAAVVNGHAGEELLDTYPAEQRPVAERVLANTRAQVALLRPDPQSDALRSLFIELMDLEQVNWYLTELMTGIGTRYEMPGDHPMTGRYCPDLVLADGTRLAELCRDGRGLLVDLADDPAVPEAAAGWADRVRVVTAPSVDAGGLTGLLVRPDGYLAWIGEGRPDTAGLASALTRWFGAAGGATRRRAR
jgi:2-polyprenyl-6-methoxyphenol hydroxylase-like FAD-dependent oxidoreductase